MVASHPQNGHFQWAFGDYCVRSRRGEQAETLLRNLLDETKTWKDTPLPAARRSLVQVLLVKPGFSFNKEALALLEKNLSADSQSLPDLRMKAHLLARRPFRQDRLKALAVFDQLSELAPLSKGDQIERILLLQNLSRQMEAKEALAKLLSQFQNDPSVLAFGISRLLDWGEATETTRGWMAQLEELASHKFIMRELNARLLVAEGKTQQAVQTFESWISTPTDSPEDPQQKIARLEQTVLALMQLTEQQDRLGQAQSADVLGNAADRLLAELLPLKPERVTWKMRFLTHRWQLDDAWQLAEEAWKTAPALDVAGALVSLLQKSREDQRKYAQIRGPLEAALTREPNSLGLKMAAGTIAQLCGEFELAIPFYRSVVEQNSNSITARNELALLLSLQGKPGQNEEALQMIERAILQDGPAHYLLDTKATVLLAMNRPRPAISLLTQAIADTPSPAKYFHLMQAHLQLDQPQEARRIYQTALANGFNISKLHPLERALGEEIAQKLKK